MSRMGSRISNYEIEELGKKAKLLTQVAEQRDRIAHYENIILQILLKGHISEALAAEWLGIGIVEVRDRMIKRYGDTWRDASGDDNDLRRRMIKAGDLDSLLEALGFTRESALAGIDAERKED